MPCESLRYKLSPRYGGGNVVSVTARRHPEPGEGSAGGMNGPLPGFFASLRMTNKAGANRKKRRAQPVMPYTNEVTYMKQRLQNSTRSLAGKTVAPYGLYMKSVKY